MKNLTLIISLFIFLITSGCSTNPVDITESGITEDGWTILYTSSFDSIYCTPFMSDSTYYKQVSNLSGTEYDSLRVSCTYSALFSCGYSVFSIINTQNPNVFFNCNAYTGEIETLDWKDDLNKDSLFNNSTSTLMVRIDPCQGGSGYLTIKNLKILAK
jgi:hypothetical protein